MGSREIVCVGEGVRGTGCVRVEERLDVETDVYVIYKFVSYECPSKRPR